VLVEKDWLSFGHPFQLRCAHGESKHERNEEQMSPIFLQFLDSVWQLVNLFPSTFEFNSRYLMLIATTSTPAASALSCTTPIKKESAAT